MTPEYNELKRPPDGSRQWLGSGKRYVIPAVGCVCGLAALYVLLLAPFRLVEPGFPLYAYIAALVLSLVIGILCGVYLGSAIIIVVRLIQRKHRRSLYVSKGENAAFLIGAVIAGIGGALLLRDRSHMLFHAIVFFGVLTLAVTTWFVWLENTAMERAALNAVEEEEKGRQEGMNQSIWTRDLTPVMWKWFGLPFAVGIVWRGFEGIRSGEFWFRGEWDGMTALLGAAAHLSGGVLMTLRWMRPSLNWSLHEKLLLALCGVLGVAFIIAMWISVL